jgi:uncharacterized repeat protein (TIGR03803 family)
MSTPVATPIQTSEMIDSPSEPGSFALTPKSRTTKSRTTLRPTHATGRTVATLCALLLAFCLTGWAASEKVLHAFHGTDGCGPTSVIVGPDGALYGTTQAAGSSTCSGDGNSGAVFQLTRGSNGKWSETVLHLFTGSDGWFPNGSLVADKAGNLYGTTVYGGPNGCSGLGCGVAFELEHGSDGEWTFSVLHQFFQKIGDGAQPYAGMIFDSKGNLYGTTSHGGNTSACEGGCGVVFELSPAREGQWTETVLYSFDATDGSNPTAALTLDSSGNLYGTTEWGGAYGGGTVFKLSQRHGQWAEEILHSFDGDTGDGDLPAFGVTFDSSGNLYGATPVGGTKGEEGYGTAFRLTLDSEGKWKETILHRFNRAKFGGGYVRSGLVLDKRGNLYGTAAWGGKYDCALGGGLGCGVVFKLTPQEGGKWTESVLHSFGNGNDGTFPTGGLALDSSGNLFGVTAEGGYTGGPCVQDGCGVVFEITP